jgi:hypothetical protein
MEQNGSKSSGMSAHDSKKAELVDEQKKLSDAIIALDKKKAELEKQKNFMTVDPRNTLELNFFYYKAHSKYYTAEIIKEFSGQSLYNDESARFNIRIQFNKDLYPINILFKSGKTWPLDGTPYGLVRGLDVNWHEFLKYHRQDSSKTTVDIEYVCSNNIRMTLTANGPLVGNSGDTYSESVTAHLEFTKKN